MKRLIHFLSILVLVFFMAQGAAAMTWDVAVLAQQQPTETIPRPVGTYSIQANGGYIETFSSSIDERIGIPILQPNPTYIDSPASNTNNWNASGASGYWDASVGGNTLPDGLSARASATASYQGMELIYGINEGRQQLNAQLWRNFDPADGGPVKVSASLGGLINWPLSGSPTEWSDLIDNNQLPIEYFGPFYHGHNITANVMVQSAQIGTVGVSYVGNFLLNWNAGTKDGSLSFTPDPTSYYILMIALNLESHLMNAMGPSPRENTGTLPISPFPLTIGEIQLNATVAESPVPIPGSLIMLASGALGLAALKRRKQV